MIPPQNPPNSFNAQSGKYEVKHVQADEISDAPDFLEEDYTLERELNRYFNLEREELPPLYVQTLLNEQVSDWMLPSDLEDRLTERVFQTLQLPQRPSTNRPAPPQKKPHSYQHLRSLPNTLGISSAFMAGMMALLMIIIPLAQQISLLLSQTGFSVSANSSFSSLALSQYLTPLQTQQAIDFPVYWLGQNPVNYSYESLVLHMHQSWSAGPVVELQYGHTDPHIGYGRLTIREFRPAGGKTTLEVVDPAAIEQIQVDDQPGVVINGNWAHQNGELFWQTGLQIQLFYESDGIVFWFTADQRDEALAQGLINLAESLKELYLQAPGPRTPELPQPPLAIQADALLPVTVSQQMAQIPIGTSLDMHSVVYLALGQPPDSSRSTA